MGGPTESPTHVATRVADDLQLLLRRSHHEDTDPLWECPQDLGATLAQVERIVGALPDLLHEATRWLARCERDGVVDLTGAGHRPSDAAAPAPQLVAAVTRAVEALTLAAAHARRAADAVALAAEHVPVARARP